MYYHRFSHGKASDIGLPWIMFKLFRGRVIKMINLQGYGRHSAEEVYRIGQEDLSALENFIGSKKYLFGERACVEDAILFAFVSQVVYFDKGPFKTFLKGWLEFKRFLIKSNFFKSNFEFFLNLKR
jgi:glutathione S-transferase